MRKTTCTILILIGLTTFAQETKHSRSSLDLSVNFQSRYIWRGLELGGNSANVQPSIVFNLGKFSIGSWGSYSLGGVNKSQESDLFTTVEISKNATITLTDYYFPTDDISNNYFNYGSNTEHVYEMMLSFSSLFKSPLEFTIATNFAGADKNGTTQNYSTYIELKYSKTVNNISYSLVAGGVVGDNGGYYLTNGSGLINLGLLVSKKIKISNAFNLPVNAAIIFNPNQNNMYLTFGITL